MEGSSNRSSFRACHPKYLEAFDANPGAATLLKEGKTILLLIHRIHQKFWAFLDATGHTTQGSLIVLLGRERFVLVDNLVCMSVGRTLLTLGIGKRGFVKQRKNSLVLVLEKYLCCFNY